LHIEDKHGRSNDFDGDQWEKLNSYTATSSPDAFMDDTVSISLSEMSLDQLKKFLHEAESISLNNSNTTTSWADYASAESD